MTDHAAMLCCCGQSGGGPGNPVPCCPCGTTSVFVSWTGGVVYQPMGCEAHVVTCNNGPNGINDSAFGFILPVLNQQITRGPASVVCNTLQFGSCTLTGTVNPGDSANIAEYEYNAIERFPPFDSGIVDQVCVGSGGPGYQRNWGTISFLVYRPQRVLVSGAPAPVPCNDTQQLLPWRVRITVKAATIWFISDSTSCTNFGNFTVLSVTGPELAYPSPCSGSSAESLDPSGIVGRTTITPGTLTIS